jgi:hypothetical protein
LIYITDALSKEIEKFSGDKIASIKSLRVRPGTFLSFAKFSDHEAYGSQTHETEC